MVRSTAIHRPHETHRQWWWPAALLSLFVLTGCGGPTNQGSPTNQDFTKVKVGMPLKQVEQMLGTGVEVLADDPEIPGVYIPTPKERADAGSPNQRWIKWVTPDHYILIGVDDGEVFSVRRQ
ncbi:hypothetical protein [Stieleria varia]|uniref:Lipoprotein SmpA/OmlA domain-containing protein n=1 Tax=Stieleria varia TaxID=2528005 RepID=A0A5C6AU33_9BACT|nr:hypothetical protein [Stieleria varia]TWU02987.1 hypothetical protein Pla52n_40760 [Stieleria varia]